MALFINGREIIVTDIIYGADGTYLRIGDAGTTARSLDSEDDLMVTGQLEVKSNAYFDAGFVSYDSCLIRDNLYMGFGNSADVGIFYNTYDANANMAVIPMPTGGGIDITAIAFGAQGIKPTVDLGLFDGVTQPTIAVIEKDTKYQSSSSGTHDGTDLDELTETDAFTSSVVGDIVRIISGDNVTAGWYRIKVKTDAHNVDLDRNFAAAGAATNVTYLIYHKIGMYNAEGSCMPAKYSDFGAGDFEMSAAGLFFGYNLTDNEIQVVLPDGTMKAIALI